MTILLQQRDMIDKVGTVMLCATRTAVIVEDTNLADLYALEQRVRERSGDAVVGEQDARQMLTDRFSRDWQDVAMGGMNKLDAERHSVEMKERHIGEFGHVSGIGDAVHLRIVDDVAKQRHEQCFGGEEEDGDSLDQSRDA